MNYSFFTHANFNRTKNEKWKFRWRMLSSFFFLHSSVTNNTTIHFQSTVHTNTTFSKSYSFEFYMNNLHIVHILLVTWSVNKLYCPLLDLHTSTNSFKINHQDLILFKDVLLNILQYWIYKIFLTCSNEF